MLIASIENAIFQNVSYDLLLEALVNLQACSRLFPKLTYGFTQLGPSFFANRFFMACSSNALSAYILSGRLFSYSRSLSSLTSEASVPPDLLFHWWSWYLKYSRLRQVQPSFRVPVLKNLYDLLSLNRDSFIVSASGRSRLRKNILLLLDATYGWERA